VVRQGLAHELGDGSPQTIERAVARLRQSLLAKARATETPSGYQMQIDFGETREPTGGLLRADR
jgi:hypothetical protein